MHTHTIDDVLRLQRDLARIYECLEEAASEAGHFGLTGRQLIILAGMTDGASVGDIDAAAYSGKNISYNIQKLVERGYMTRGGNDLDRRLRPITRTDKGRDLAALVLRALAPAPAQEAA